MLPQVQYFMGTRANRLQCFFATLPNLYVVLHQVKRNHLSSLSEDAFAGRSLRDSRHGFVVFLPPSLSFFGQRKSFPMIIDRFIELTVSDDVEDDIDERF